MNYHLDRLSCFFFFIVAISLVSSHASFAATITPFSPSDYSPALAVDMSGNPYLAWERVLDDQQNDIFFTKSADGGTTFLPSKCINTNPHTQARASLAIDRLGNPFVVWFDTRDGQSHIYFARSYDGGDTFTYPVRIDTTADPEEIPQISFDSKGNPVVVWVRVKWYNWKNPLGHIYITRSYDGGVTFLPSVCVDCNLKPYQQGWPSLAIDAQDNAVVAWHDFRNGNWDIYLSKTTNGGLTFSPSALVVNNPSHQFLLSKRALAVDSSGNPHIAFSDNRNGNWDIYYVRSYNGGGSFLEPVSVDIGPAVQFMPTISVDLSNNPYLVWLKGVNGYPQVFFSKSLDGGQNFTPPQQIYAISATQNRPYIVLDSLNNVHIVWVDNRSGRYDIYYTKSIDGGAIFSTPVLVP